MKIISNGLFVKDYGWISTPDHSKQKSILIGCGKAFKNKKVLIGAGLTLACAAFTLISAFNHGSQTFMETEEKVLSDLGLFN